MSEPNKTRKLKIISDGTPQGTSVVDAETGEPIDGVTDVRLEVNRYRVTATVTISQPLIDVTTEATVRPVVETTPAKQQ